jgi:hypothetical protein
MALKMPGKEAANLARHYHVCAERFELRILKKMKLMEVAWTERDASDWELEMLS